MLVCGVFASSGTVLSVGKLGIWLRWKDQVEKAWPQNDSDLWTSRSISGPSRAHKSHGIHWQHRGCLWKFLCEGACSLASPHRLLLVWTETYCMLEIYLLKQAWAPLKGYFNLFWAALWAQLRLCLTNKFIQWRHWNLYLMQIQPQRQNKCNSC